MQRPAPLRARQAHGVFGYAGSRAAALLLPRLGGDAWPLNTLHFSPHTQYGQWAGEVWAAAQIPARVEGLAAIGAA